MAYEVHHLSSVFFPFLVFTSKLYFSNTQQPHPIKPQDPSLLKSSSLQVSFLGSLQDFLCLTSCSKEFREYVRQGDFWSGVDLELKGRLLKFPPICLLWESSASVGTGHPDSVMLAFPTSCCVVTRGESLAARKRRTYAMHARSTGKSADLHARHVLEDGATNLPSNFHACAASFGYELSGPGLAISQYPGKQHVHDLPEALYSRWAAASPTVQW